MVTVLILGPVGVGGEKHDFPTINSATDRLLATFSDINHNIAPYFARFSSVTIPSYSIM